MLYGANKELPNLTSNQQMEAVEGPAIAIPFGSVLKKAQNEQVQYKGVWECLAWDSDSLAWKLSALDDK